MVGADEREDQSLEREGEHMQAAVQADSSSHLPALLRIEKHSGHGGADLVKQAVEMSTDEYTFLMSQMGIVC